MPYHLEFPVFSFDVAYNTVVILAAALAYLSIQNDVMVCKKDSHGKVVATKAQWIHVHKLLASKDSKQVLGIIHPKHDLMVRQVSTSFPEPSGEIKVYRNRWSRSTVIERLRNIGGYDYNHPGYQYDMVRQMDPLAKHPEGPVMMKGFLMYVKSELPANYQINSYPSKKANARYRQDYKKHSPITFVRLAAYDGKLWLAEISGSIPAE